MSLLIPIFVGGGRGRWFIDISGGGGVVKKRESPDFRSPEVGISVFGDKSKQFMLKVCQQITSEIENSTAVLIK